MKKLIAFLTGLGVLFTVFGAYAQDRTLLELKTHGTKRTLVLPLNADESPVLSLGTSIDPKTKEAVEGIAFIHYKKEFSHTPKHNGGAATTSCYAFLAKGAKWKSVEPWLVNPTNSRGIDEAYIASNITGDIFKWEDAADGAVNGILGANILGGGTTTFSPLTAENTAPDGLNEVYFADVSSTGAIAVTIVWGRFSGPVSQRRLVEWDMIIDDVDFDWSQTGEPGKMDFENIITHELGHAVGMGHPVDTCAEETMFRFADFGEIKKQSLNSGDIAGINILY